MLRVCASRMHLATAITIRIANSEASNAMEQLHSAKLYRILFWSFFGVCVCELLLLLLSFAACEVLMQTKPSLLNGKIQTKRNL